MTSAAPDPGLARLRRKQDLLLASRLARGQAVLACDELAARANSLALQALRARQWLSDPRVVAVGGAAVGLVAVLTLRRVRPVRLVRVLRWGWLAWRLWHSARRLQALRPPAFGLGTARGAQVLRSTSPSMATSGSTSAS